MKASILDKYVQRIAQSVTCPLAAGTGTTTSDNQVDTSWNPKDKMGMLIQRIEYMFDETIMNLDAVLDSMKFGVLVTSAAQPTSGYAARTSGVLDFNQIAHQYGTLVGGFEMEKTIRKDFHQLSGGGLLAHPASLYLFAWNQSTANWAADVVYITNIYYQLVELSDADWAELWQLGFITNTL